MTAAAAQILPLLVLEVSRRDHYHAALDALTLKEEDAEDDAAVRRLSEAQTLLNDAATNVTRCTLLLLRLMHEEGAFRDGLNGCCQYLTELAAAVSRRHGIARDHARDHAQDAKDGVNAAEGDDGRDGEGSQRESSSLEGDWYALSKRRACQVT
jgi:hypothetical protein